MTGPVLIDITRASRGHAQSTAASRGRDYLERQNDASLKAGNEVFRSFFSVPLPPLSRFLRIKRAYVLFYRRLAQHGRLLEYVVNYSRFAVLVISPMLLIERLRQRLNSANCLKKSNIS